MRKIEVEIEGQSPLLMHNPASMLEPKTTRITTAQSDPKIDAEKYAYKLKDGMLYVPASAIFGTMMNGASFKKAGKYSLKSILAGNIKIEPVDKIPLGVKNYEIDIRTVVNQQGKRKNRIVLGRPMLKEWKLRFEIIYNEEIIADADLIKEALKDAGIRVGILSFSPRNQGSFGTFKISKWKVI